MVLLGTSDSGIQIRVCTNALTCGSTCKHTPTLWHSHPGYISVTARACQRQREKNFCTGTWFAHSANKPTDAAAGQSVRNILKGMASVLQKLTKLDQAHIRPAGATLSLMKTMRRDFLIAAAKVLAFKASPELGQPACICLHQSVWWANTERWELRRRHAVLLIPINWFK